jgi:RNA polymerase sigma-70 factor (ECF subfamily)
VGPDGSGVSRTASVVDPADLAVDHERRAAVLAALETLPLDQRAALVLVDMEGYSVEETARILDCAPGTVKSRCSRGRARLLPLLTTHDPGRPVGAEGNPRAAPRVGSPVDSSGDHQPPDERPLGTPDGQPHGPAARRLDQQTPGEEVTRSDS